MLAQWDPFAEIARVHDRLFQPSAASERAHAWRPPVDIHEDEAGIHVQVDVPGVKPEDIKVEVENKILTIRGERALERADDKNGYHRVERYHGVFSRSFALSDEVSADEIQAKYDSGVLRVDLPKRATAKRREIAVNS